MEKIEPNIREDTKILQLKYRTLNSILMGVMVVLIFLEISLVIVPSLLGFSLFLLFLLILEIWTIVLLSRFRRLGYTLAGMVGFLCILSSLLTVLFTSLCLLGAILLILTMRLKKSLFPNEAMKGSFLFYAALILVVLSSPNLIADVWSSTKYQILVYSTRSMDSITADAVAKNDSSLCYEKSFSNYSFDRDEFWGFYSLYLSPNLIGSCQSVVEDKNYNRK